MLGVTATASAAAAARTHGGNPWAAARAQGRGARELLDFSVDLNPCGYPPSVRRLILEHLDDIQRYPDPSATAMREAIAASHGIAAAEILVGNGSAELIALLPRLFPAARAVVASPTFSEYAWAVEQAGGFVEHLCATETSAFHFEWTESFWRRRLAAADAVFLCNPNNPTGALVPREQVWQLAGWCRDAGARLIVDEAFLDFVAQPASYSVAADIRRFDNLIVLRSFTKSFAIPGLRLGYLAASEPLVDILRAAQPPWPLNAFALAVGPALLQEHEHLEGSRREIAGLRRQLSEALGRLAGCYPYPSTTNFFLCRLAHPAPSSSELTDRLAGRGILIRNGDSFHGLEPGRFIRVAVRSQEDNARLVSALEEIVRHAG